MKTRLKWLDRTVILSPYCIALCTKEADFKHELRRLKVPNTAAPDWIIPGKDATVHTLEGRNGLCCIVCIDRTKKPRAIEVVGLLIHEAVHIWQAICQDMEEDRPGVEIEAYAIQRIAQNLIEAYRI